MVAVPIWTCGPGAWNGAWWLYHGMFGHCSDRQILYVSSTDCCFVPRAGFYGLKLFMYLVGSLVEIPSEPAANITRSLLVYVALAQGAYQ
jgi:hypothetical protein